MFAVDTLQFAEADRVYQRYCNEFPNDPLPYFYRASVLETLEKVEEATSLYSKSIELDPDYAFVMSRAINFLLRGQLESAERDWRAGKRIDPGAFTEQIRMGIAISKPDRPTFMDALSTLKASSATFLRSQAATREGCWLCESGDYDGAAKVIESGYSFDRETGASLDDQHTKLILLARIHLLRRKSSDAVSICRNLLRESTGQVDRMAVGSVLAEAGDISTAEKCLSPNLTKWPIYEVHAQRLAGEIEFARGNFAGALSAFRKARLPRSKRYWPGFLVRGAIAAGDFETAGQALRDLFAAPGVYWLSPERNQPGFVSAGIAWVHELKKWPDLEERVARLAQTIFRRLR
jgi:tetratricopeptide (TPR) repeat protein